MADLGARVGEIVKLKQSTINLRRKQVVLDGKTRERTVNYSDAFHPLYAALKAGPVGPDGRAFHKKPNSLRTMVNRRLAKITKELGIPRFTSNGFRRRKATDLMEAGLSPINYKSFMGHSPKVGLDIYAGVLANAGQHRSVPHYGPQQSHR
jgi:integrase